MQSAFLDLIQLIVDGDENEVARVLRIQPDLARMASQRGATRQEPTEYFYPEITHYLYAGDTPLHMAAAALSKAIAKRLISFGGNPRAKNRRGAEPLHYAADGDRSKPEAQIDVIEYLISVGADPNSKDKSGVTPLHRAVRRRSFAACRALLGGGAKPRQPNGWGSTPLHLAVQTAGASGSGTDTARENQAAIIELLLKHGARSTDVNMQGKQVIQAASSDWIRDLLRKWK
jgi:ankyrin repeat protein